MQKYRRLCNFGLLEFVGRTFEHYVGNAESEDFVCLFKHLLGLRNIFIQVLTHARELCTLSREDISMFHQNKILIFMNTAANIRKFSIFYVTRLRITRMAAV